jgi:hypothetical protein
MPTQINQFMNGTKTVNIIQNDDNTYLVDFSYTDIGLFLNAGMFSTQALAEAKAQEMLHAELYTAEMLVGDVAVAVVGEPVSEPVNEPASEPVV